MEAQIANLEDILEWLKSNEKDIITHGFYNLIYGLSQTLATDSNRINTETYGWQTIIPNQQVILSSTDGWIQGQFDELYLKWERTISTAIIIKNWSSRQYNLSNIGVIITLFKISDTARCLQFDVSVQHPKGQKETLVHDISNISSVNTDISKVLEIFKSTSG